MEDQIKVDYDARVVQTVRNLKKIPPRDSGINSSVLNANQNLNSIGKSDEDKYFF